MPYEQYRSRYISSDKMVRGDPCTEGNQTAKVRTDEQILQE